MVEVEFPSNGWDGRMSTQSRIGGGVLRPGFDEEDGHVRARQRPNLGSVSYDACPTY